MLSGIRTAKLLTPVRPNLFQRPAAKPASEGENGPSNRTEAASATPKATVEAGKGGNADKPKAKTTAKPGGKTVVDQRTTDTPSMRITVISYSDGSSETLREIKNVDKLGARNGLVSTNKPISLSAPGIMIDKLA